MTSSSLVIDTLVQSENYSVCIARASSSAIGQMMSTRRFVPYSVIRVQGGDHHESTTARCVLLIFHVKREATKAAGASGNERSEESTRHGNFTKCVQRSNNQDQSIAASVVGCRFASNPIDI